MAPCPDAASYARRGESCLVAHHQTCPKCHGEGRLAFEGMLIPGSREQAARRMVECFRQHRDFKGTAWDIDFMEELLSAALGEQGEIV